MVEEALFTLALLALLLLAGVGAGVSSATAASLLAELPKPTLGFLESLDVEAEREGVAAGCSSGTEEVLRGLSRERWAEGLVLVAEEKSATTVLADEVEERKGKLVLVVGVGLMRRALEEPGMGREAVVSG